MRTGFQISSLVPSGLVFDGLSDSMDSLAAMGIPLGGGGGGGGGRPCPPPRGLRLY
jgi:hypothetical protein